jgi:signal transduction histidine kinase
VLDRLRRKVAFFKDYDTLGLLAPTSQSVEECIQRPRGTINLYNISLDVESKGLVIYADPSLEKVFHSLIDNSMRHGERVTHIRISCRTSVGGLTLVFEDDGIGIPDSDKEKIFLRGFGKDTGLGFFLSREILDVTGVATREIGVYGRGARFGMRVPKGGYQFPGQGNRP